MKVANIKITSQDIIKHWWKLNYFQGGSVPDPVISALELTFDDIANVPVADASSVSDWNTYFDLPTNGSPFTSVEVVGDMVRLIGGSEITLKTNLFFEDTSLITINDFAGCVTQVNSSALFGATSCQLINLPELINLQNNGFVELSYEGVIFNLPKLVNIGFYCFGAAHAHSLLLPEVTNIGNSFWNMSAHTENIDEIYMPKLNTIGDTVGYNNCFIGITGQTITLTIPAALMTCNSGNPDGDIQYLIDNNTVTIVTV